MSPESKAHQIRRVIFEWLLYILLFLAAVIVVPRYIVQRTIVTGESMENTFWNGDQLLIEKVTRHFKEYERFDIVVFDPANDFSQGHYVKRIIGLPGETVQIIGENIYINGEVLVETFGKSPIVYAGLAAEPITLQEGEYFVLGDNRDISLDSRYESVGLVEQTQMEGKVILQIYPLSKFGMVD